MNPIVNNFKMFDIYEDILVNKYVEKITHPHSHDFFEICFICSGKGKHIIGEIEYEINQGDIYIVDKYTTHEMIPYENSPFVLYNCIFYESFLDYSTQFKHFFEIAKVFFLRSLIPENFVFSSLTRTSPKEYEIIDNLYNKMVIEYWGKSHGYIEILRAYLIELIILIFRIQEQNYRYNNLEVVKHEQLEGVIKFINFNFEKSITLSHLSKMMYMSDNQLCRVFKKYTGLTVTEYIQKIRIDHACDMLKNTNQKILSISYNVGYTDIKFFNTLFKRITSKTPSEYRKYNSMIAQCKITL